ncbi:ER-golgi trafficking TRAPP I complex 85 kDa subunit-domain-containing protein [Gongronella butleri]|nr:ER-golgi trafficking TRAPP I complex 85 kDa subunit-domain-containing protein [Gongronella butleri]
MMHSRGITEHNTFDHPVAVMIAISSANPDPMGTIMQLYNPNVPSFVIDRPYVDTNILRYYVLIHDPQQTTWEHSEAVFDKMKKNFGLHCHLLTLSSQPQGGVDVASNGKSDLDAIWQPHLASKAAYNAAIQRHMASAASVNLAVAPGPSLIDLDVDTPTSPSTPMSMTRSNSASSSLSFQAQSPTPPPQQPPIQPSATILPLPTSHTLDSSTPDLTIDTTRPNEWDAPDAETTPAEITHYGVHWTLDQVDATNVMVRELVVQSILPFMERNIQHWNEQVASARRGLTGRLFGASRRLFGSTHSKSPSAQSIQSIPATGPNVPAGITSLTIYPSGAAEAQMRKLADYAFMLHDYKFAHVIYDTVRRDFATDKAYKYHAATQEMLGLCLLLMSPQLNKAEVDRHFELAVQQYLGRCLSPFDATRATVLFYELLKDRQCWKEMPSALVRMTAEDSDLRSALFLEQAAHCFLRIPRPMVRKYAFHLVMAGHRYTKALQRRHAFRCYAAAAQVLDTSLWSVAKNHVQFALGRQAFHLNLLEDAVEHFVHVISDAKQTPQQQLDHIREFLFVYQQYTQAAGIDPLFENLPGIGIPQFEDQGVRVNLSNEQPNTDRQDEWNAMERQLLDTSIANGYLRSSKKALALQQQDDDRLICAVGEPCTVHFECHNPLQVAVTLSKLVLGCQYGASVKLNATKSAFLEDTMVPGTPNDDGMLDLGDFQVQLLSQVHLDPLERRTVSLKLIPQKEGSISVRGVHYTVNDQVHTFHAFEKQGKRLNDTLAQRVTPTWAEDHTLDILVTLPMPLLDLQFHNVPDTMLSGQVVQAVMEINNKGNRGLTSLCLKTSHPNFCAVGHPQHMDAPVYEPDATATDRITCHTRSSPNQLMDPSVMLIPLPSDNDQHQPVVPSGQTTLVPLWLRGDRIGSFTLQLLFSYQSEEENSAIAYRTLRYTLPLQVQPSLKINAFTRPSLATTDEYLLGIEIENMQPSTAFDLRQLTTISPHWTLTPISIDMTSAQDIKDKSTIPPRQTTFAYYKLRSPASAPVSDAMTPEAWSAKALASFIENDAKASAIRPPPLDLLVTNVSFVSH